MDFVNIACIGLVWIFILDFSGFRENLEDYLANRWGKEPGTVHIKKPFGCARCMTFWCGLLYIGLFCKWSEVAVMAAYLCGISYLVVPFTHVLKWLEVKFELWIMKRQ